MDWRHATSVDLPQLAFWNRELQEDEGAEPLAVAPITDRLRRWLADEYRAVVFTVGSAPVGYALFRPSDPDLQGADAIYLRQFFVARDQRRKGYGSCALQRLLDEVFEGRKVILEALEANPGGSAFWRAQGFVPYATTYHRAAPNK